VLSPCLQRCQTTSQAAASEAYVKNLRREQQLPIKNPSPPVWRDTETDGSWATETHSQLRDTNHTLLIGSIAPARPAVSKLWEKHQEREASDSRAEPEATSNTATT